MTGRWLAALAVLTGVTAAAGGGQSGETSRRAERSFERIVAPFEVRGRDDRPIALPFLGGLDVPRPQFVDIDGDGDVDLFVQEYTNTLWHLENTGGGRTPRFEWRSDRYQDLDIGEWYRFVDVDGDGRLDLLTEEPFSHIRFYRNTGTRERAAFARADTLRDSAGEPVFLDRQNVPALVDLDCDGRLDLFIGRVEGTVARYEAEQPGGIRFELVAERFEDIEIIGGGGATFGTMRHGANALAFADFDGDRDLDLFWGDFFEAGMLLIRNIGRTCSSPSFQVEPVRLPYADGLVTSGYNAPAPVDLDQDGDLDFLMGVLGGSYNPVATAAENFHWWERTAPDRLELRTKRFLDALDFGSETSPALGDIDGDGDIDIITGNKIDPAAADAGRLVVLLNDGTAARPRFRIADTLRLTDAYHLAPALGDLDADGDPDLLIGTWNQGVLLFRNDGSAREPRWIADAAATIALPRGSHASPALGDVDQDGDLDLFLGQSSGGISVFRNDGTAQAPRFTLVEEQLAGVRAGRRSSPVLVDVDGDGRLDLVVGREQPGAVVYRQTGSRSERRFVEDPTALLPLPPLSSPRLADMNGDKTLDVISGTISGGLVFLQAR